MELLVKKSHISFIIRLSMENIIGADIAAASVLISMGALLGRISPIQLLMMGLIEIILFASNEYLQIELMKVRTEMEGCVCALKTLPQNISIFIWTDSRCRWFYYGSCFWRIFWTRLQFHSSSEKRKCKGWRTRRRFLYV